MTCHLLRKQRTFKVYILYFVIGSRLNIEFRRTISFALIYCFSIQPIWRMLTASKISTKICMRNASNKRRMLTNPSEMSGSTKLLAESNRSTNPACEWNLLFCKDLSPRYQTFKTSFEYKFMHMCRLTKDLINKVIQEFCIYLLGSVIIEDIRKVYKMLF